MQVGSITAGIRRSAQYLREASSVDAVCQNSMHHFKYVFVTEHRSCWSVDSHRMNAQRLVFPSFFNILYLIVFHRAAKQKINTVSRQDLRRARKQSGSRLL
jgi:hypothetical protein